MVVSLLPIAHVSSHPTQVQENMESLVKVYVNVRANAVKYKTVILPSLISLAKDLNSHTSIVDVCRVGFHFRLT